MSVSRNFSGAAGFPDSPTEAPLPLEKIVAKPRIAIGLGELMGRSGQLAYWMVMVLSGLWLVLSAASGAGLLFKLAWGHEHFDKHSITEIVIGSIVVFQPLLIGWLIKRAHRMRMIGGSAYIIGRAALPMSTIALLFAAYAANNYYNNLILEKDDWERRNRTITYDCSQHSQVVDYDPNQIGVIGLRLISIRRGQVPEKWLVNWPGQAPIAATNFYVDTGSIGGSQGISWQSANGTNMVAIMSFSDILSRYGTSEIGVTIREGNMIGPREILESIELQDFTCEPNLETYQPNS